MNLISLEGNSQKLDGGAMFGNIPKTLWEKWLPADQDNKIFLTCRCLLVQVDQKNILLETGIGAFFEPKLQERYGVMEKDHVLLRSLAQHGLSDSNIDYIILSHLHFDHAGGLLSPWSEAEDHSLLFPNAKYIVSEKAWQRAKHPHPRDRASFIPKLTALLEQSQRLEIVTQNQFLGRYFFFHMSDGHTPGMLLTEIKTPEGPILFAADLIPGVAWIHLPVTMGYDRFPELVIDEKKQVLADMINRNGRVFFTHDPNYAIANIALDEQNHFIATNMQKTLQCWS